MFIKDDGQRSIVPLEYADKEKFIKRLENDPELDKKIQIVFPRMSYEMSGFSYDKERKLNTNNKNFASNPLNADRAFMQYNPVPYDFNFNLILYTRNVEDGNQIIEQILPYFTIDYSLRLKLVPEMGIVKTVPVILNRATQSIDSIGSYNSTVRTVIWTLSFTVKSYIFGAVKDVPLIKSVEENYITTIGGSLASDVGTTCNPFESRTFELAPGGYGDYKINETVYQGQNLELAYATGKVKYWSNTSNTLVLVDGIGKFKINQPMIGLESFSIHLPTSSNANTMIAFTANTQPEPNTANAESYWEPNVTITEYNS